MSFADDMDIDPNGLDVEWLGHSALMMRYGKQAADARYAMDLGKERLELVKAELARDIRADPEDFGIEKLTEAVVAATILLQDKYTDAMTAYLDAKHVYHVADAATRAADARKSALEALTKLLGLEYFAAPSTPRNLHEQKKARAKGKIKKKKKEKK